MTYVKKISHDWHPAENITLNVGGVMDCNFPVDQLLREGKVVLCDKEGNELSTYGATGILTDVELVEFRAWVELKAQQSLKKQLESERETLLAEAEKLKKENELKPAIVETTDDQIVKRKAWAEKMAAARAAKKAAKK